jgi:hypothetical protein
MLRKILGVVAGLLTGVIVVYIGDATSHRLYPPPPNIADMGRTALGEFVMTIPTYILVIMLLFWMLSTFLGALVTSLITRPKWRTPSMITGAILMAASITNMAFIPHPTWMLIAAIVLYLPAAYFGGMAGAGKTRAANS